MSLASIQKIVEVRKHPNADALDICKVLNYECITKRDQYKVGDLVVFIEPDTVLPDAPWAAFYKAKSGRVKAIKLRGEWSFGIIEDIVKLGLQDLHKEKDCITFQENLLPQDSIFYPKEGDDVSEILGITKYEPPAPQDLSAQGVYGFGIPKTDETRWQGLRDIPFGEVCDVTLKIDGQSWSAVCKLEQDENKINQLGLCAIGGRSFLFKPDAENKYKENEKRYDVLKKLSEYCMNHGISLCIRGEQYGKGIQTMAHNPHCKLDLNLAFFSTWLIDERRYATKGHPLYIFNLAPILGLPTVPILEKDVVITRELIAKYDHELEKIDGNMFEGVVVNWKGGSFKIINKHYDAKK